MSLSENTIRVPEQVEKAEHVSKDDELGDSLEKTIEETAAALRRPDVVAALQKRLHAEMLNALPASVKRRIKSLKKIQLEVTHLEAKFYEEVHNLEMKYHDMYTPLYEKRGEIILGKYEPTDDECQWTLDDEKDEDVGEGEKKKTESELAAEGDNIKIDDIKGVPDFWLTIFKNVQMLSEMVQDHDEPVLKHLQDIKVLFRQANPMGFILEFHFSPNEYFTNSVLTKQYEMKCVPDEQDPFSFEGPEIFKCKGCTIDWKEGKNVTLKVFNKKEKQESGEAITTTKTVQNDSFFNFFSPPNIPDDADADVDEETQTLLISDFEIGHYIRERLIPRAVLYFTGEALEDEEYEEEEEEDDDEDEDDDDDGDEDDDDDDEAPVPQDTTRQPCRPC